ncbi:DUF4269 domain-containing protein [Flavobacterium circumlabens]|uniref:DUF4269 domain-containing protein n=1 Tax=Flavobacterium circumlabens TaxID=2133765 RepID=A0A4Y7U7K9_9FLAO|nr:DUF4269 domain-containing protein [Flavobacterium circumlabens]TCN50348.1 uncharacterized protein DUF4269 [Flavobacterium circumlabens]TEB41772.1 DUF4269 domain-containing protein [Flavobacterium circumlabens]
MTDFTTLDYLKTGNQKQIRAYEVLTQNKILSQLAEFDPLLVGTIPINIAIENSDLDIICYWKDKTHFIEKLTAIFGTEAEFTIRETTINNQESIIANFRKAAFEIEIFGQNIPVQNQNGYRHMIIEYNILQLKGEKFRLEIIRLKQNGYKTEPAFGLLLGLKDDPYTELLDYKF